MAPLRTRSTMPRSVRPSGGPVDQIPVGGRRCPDGRGRGLRRPRATATTTTGRRPRRRSPRPSPPTRCDDRGDRGDRPRHRRTRRRRPPRRSRPRPSPTSRPSKPRSPRTTRARRAAPRRVDQEPDARRPRRASGDDLGARVVRTTRVLVALIRELVEQGQRVVPGEPDVNAATVEQVELSPDNPTVATVTVCIVFNDRRIGPGRRDRRRRSISSRALRIRQQVQQTPNGWLPASPFEPLAGAEGVDDMPRTLRCARVRSRRLRAVAAHC